MNWPTLDQVRAAGKEQLAYWYRFLPIARDEDQLAVVNLVYHHFHELGGFTPELSKSIGWDQPQ